MKKIEAETKKYDEYGKKLKANYNAYELESQKFYEAEFNKLKAKCSNIVKRKQQELKGKKR